MSLWACRISLLVLVLACAGCASTPLRPPSGNIRGISAASAAVILRNEQDVRVASNLTFLLPAGEYRAVIEDDIGVYFQTPGKVFMRENFLGIQLPNKPFDGGIYLERAAPDAAKIYIITPANQGGEIQRMLRGGRPGKPFVPRQPIVFELRRS